MISTTAVPSGERGGASFTGSVRSRASSLSLAFHVHVVRLLNSDYQKAAAVFHEGLDLFLLGSAGNGLQVDVAQNQEFGAGQLRIGEIGCRARARLTSNCAAVKVAGRCGSWSAESWLTYNSFGRRRRTA